MRKKIIYYSIAFLSIFFLFFYLITPRTFSADCTLGMDLSSKSPEELNSIVTACGQKVNDLRSTANTLSSQIQYMDTQIYLTTIKIQATEQKITDMQKEIELLTGRIEGLDKSLNYLSKTLLERIVQNYKTQSVSLLNLFLDSSTAFDFLNKAKYQKTTQENNQKLLMQVQESKLNFEEQKKIREKKKVELANLQNTLNQQQVDLNNQKTGKQKLLADTKNDETTYQRLLTQARQQLAAFKSFVQTSGSGNVIEPNALGTGSDNSYYSQRDSRWAYQTIGSSSENILNVGCLLTSVSMVAKHYGDNVTPSNIASDVSRFYGFTAYMNLPWKSVAGRSYHGGIDVDQELDKGNYVIVGVGGCNNGGSHFVVLTKKDGTDYIMHDPIYGPDLKFSSHYSNICSAATFK